MLLIVRQSIGNYIVTPDSRFTCVRSEGLSVRFLIMSEREQVNDVLRNQSWRLRE